MGILEYSCELLSIFIDFTSVSHFTWLTLGQCSIDTLRSDYDCFTTSFLIIRCLQLVIRLHRSHIEKKNDGYVECRMQNGHFRNIPNVQWNKLDGMESFTPKCKPSCGNYEHIYRFCSEHCNCFILSHIVQSDHNTLWFVVQVLWPHEMIVKLHNIWENSFGTDWEWKKNRAKGDLLDVSSFPFDRRIKKSWMTQRNGSREYYAPTIRPPLLVFNEIQVSICSEQDRLSCFIHGPLNPDVEGE